MTDIAADGWGDQTRLIDRRMALAREWDDLVEQVRNLPGFEDFLKPPPLTSLLPAAADGPVAVINVSRWRCDALLVTTDGVKVQELPALTAADVERRVVEYLSILEDAADAAHEYRAAVDAAPAGASPATDERLAAAATRHRTVRTRAETALRLILVWLWETVTKPVLDALEYTTTPPVHAGASADAGYRDWPRLWWCPTGLLTLLPLHAAGDHTAAGPQRPTVLDRVVSSYTPTLRALVEARKPVTETEDPARMLAVMVAEAEGEEPLPTVAAETEALRHRFGDRCRILDDTTATVARTRELLPGHRWVHFSCHGTQLLNDPSRGGVRLVDGMLTVGEISIGEYHGDFAFLSACKTATGGVELADEAITLAAALHYTGYRHVIGTLWTVYESTAAAVAKAVYGDDTAVDFQPARSAVRLHGVQRDLRDNTRLSAWTPFMHTGP